MTRYLIGLILTLTILSCQKDESQKDYSLFLAKTSESFQGILDENSFSMNYGLNQFQKLEGYDNGNGVCDSDDPSRVVKFGLTSSNDLKTGFILYSPMFDSTSYSEIYTVFSLGKKKLGDYKTDFYLSINMGNNLYQSSGFNFTNEIEILKTQEFIDSFDNLRKIRVWIKLDARLSSCGCQDNNSVLTDGLMIAEFRGIR